MGNLENKIIVWTDGGCSGNPGPGAWAFVITKNGEDVIYEKAGSEKHTTNNRMELQAVINALHKLKNLDLQLGAEVRTDSLYVKKGVTEWMTKWKSNGWRTAGKTPVKNAELWGELDGLNEGLKLKWRWVKGHAGTFYNERCDRLVQEAIAEIKKT